MFGVLTTAQQISLVSPLTKQEAQDLLARFQPNSPFTDSVLDSLLDFGAVLSAAQLGQLIDNVTEPQGTEYIQCDGSVRDCIGEFVETEGAPVGIMLDGSRVFGLTAFGADVAEVLRQEILQELGLTPTNDTEGVHLASMFMRILGNLDAADVGEINDIFGGGFLGYTANGGIQAGELLQNPNGPNADQKIDIKAYANSRRLGEGFFEYFELLDEDFSNAAALNLIDSADHASFSAGLMYHPSDRKSLLDLVTSQMEMSSIRERDARLENEADARAGAVISEHEGRRTRIGQSIVRPQSRPDEIQVVNVTDTPDSENRLAYIDFRTRFTVGALNGKSSAQIRNLPWNDYLTTLYSGDVNQCETLQNRYTMVGSP